MKYIIGADEVGRGCLAGPVTVGAVLAPIDMVGMGVTDSKKLSPKRREDVDRLLRKCPDIKHVLVSAPAQDIDAFGITECLRRCFESAIEMLLVAVPRADVQVAIDGMPLNGLNFAVLTEYVIKGDDKVWSIGAASILAKVHRDEFMADESHGHPYYGWGDNAGYGTAGHIAAIKAHGLTKMHRASFCRSFVPQPVSHVVPAPAGELGRSIIEDLFS